MKRYRVYGYYEVEAFSGEEAIDKHAVCFEITNVEQIYHKEAS